MKKILLDQGLPAFAATILREQGWDAIHVREIGMRDATDSEILDLAERENRVAITLDRDFSQLLALARRASPSVVFVRMEGMKAREIAELVGAIWQKHDADLRSGCVVIADSRGYRVRRLPIATSG